MADAANPLIPAAYDLVWSGVAVLALALAVLSLVSIARSARALTPVPALGWTLLAIFVPVAGPLAWLVIGRRTGAGASEPAPAAKP
ncbi:PLD nuclease N-terminal domain-containing protein [Microbacterium hominis]|uniref:PLDc_N domain-containing protein n=1 Tax=Microbacterium hominis TaxID=162426 RepID=A0A7D4U427_9MICO|nr:PLD nuclease N-terminal domain-containing protein [Microbacterium hominis]QKJ19085.1 PLDc_N domain-containing protein [Microbacterium hominis]